MNSKDAKHLYALLKSNLEKKGIMVKWWIETHLSEMNYSTAMAQLNDHNPMSEYVEKSIKKYLEA